MKNAILLRTVSIAKENDLSMIEIENTMEMKDVVERNCKITTFYYKSGMMFYNLVNKVSYGRLLSTRIIDGWRYDSKRRKCCHRRFVF